MVEEPSRGGEVQLVWLIVTLRDALVAAAATLLLVPAALCIAVPAALAACENGNVARRAFCSACASLASRTSPRPTPRPLPWPIHPLNLT